MPDPKESQEQVHQETEEEETRPLTEEDHSRARQIARALLRGGEEGEEG